MSNVKSRASLALAALIAAFALVPAARGTFLSGVPKVAPTKNESLPVVAAVRRDIREVIEVSGEFRPYQEVELDAKVRGYVRKLNADVGSAVEKGDVLASLEIPELQDELAKADASVAVAKQQAEKARAQFEDEKAVYDRLQQVMKERPALIAQQDLDQSRAKANAASAALVAAQSMITEAQAVRTRELHLSEYSKIIAPFPGVITKRYADEGALVGATTGAGSPVFHLSEIDRLRLVINVPESSVPDVQSGRKASIEIGALGKSFELPVSRISHQLAMDTRTMHVEIDFDNPKGEVAAGMYAQVSLPLKERSQVTSVPLRAIRDRKGDDGRVYVLDGAGSVQVRSVKLGLVGSSDAEVISGVSDGELVTLDVVPILEKDIRYSAKRLDQEPVPSEIPNKR